MGGFKVLVLVLVFLKVQSFRLDEGCEVKEKWEEQIKWPVIHISLWKPRNGIKFMELEMSFKEKEDLTFYDRVMFNESHCTLEKTRNLDTSKTFHNISVKMEEGWNDFLVRIDGNYSVWHMGSGNESLLVDVPVEFPLKTLKVQGSNVTLNCHSNKRIWQVSGNPINIPFNSSKENRIGFYSNARVRPFINLGTRNTDLRWDGNALTTLRSTGPLPNFRVINVIVTCAKQETTFCIIKEGDTGKKLDDGIVGNLPEFMTVGGESPDPFSVLIERVNTPKTLSASDQENQSSTAVGLFVVFLLLAIFAITVLSYKLYKRPKESIKEDIRKIENADFHEVSQLLRSDDEENEDELLRAVLNSSLHQAKTILEAGGNIDDVTCEAALVEAHLMCKTDMIQVLSSKMTIERERLIQSVQKEFNARITSIFNAAKIGSYIRGVAKFLTMYELPATIKNEQGLSLLHIIASAKYFDDGPPLWSASDVRSFLNNPTVYPNAVNFRGQTCLHLLSSCASHSKKTVTWDSQETTAENAWLKLAEILVEFQCDPTVRDLKGQLPHECAKKTRNIQLSDYLEKCCRDSDQKKKTKLNFSKAIRDAEKGKTNTLKIMLIPHQQKMPLESSNSPLAAAVTRGHLQTVQLLLSSGAYVCGRSRISITPLEAAHGVKSLPAIFPAMMRRECINRLSAELSMIGGSSENLSKLVQDLIFKTENGLIIPLNFGDGSQTDEEKSKEARDLLCTAAKLGLTLTCQMIGLLNVSLHTFPHEEKAVTEALQSGNSEVMYVFSRDLQMTLFPHIDEGKLPEAFLNDLWGHEVRQLNQVFSKLDKATEYAKLMSKIQDVRKEGSNLELPDKEVLAIIAQYGLTYIFHVIKPKIKNFSINSPVDDFTGCTMLHIAAMYGQQRMVEYLLHDTPVVDVMCKCKKGLTAADWAAIRGNEECVKYLLFCLKNDYEESDGETVALKYLSGYKNLINEYKNFFTGLETYLEVWSTPTEKDKARLLLENCFHRYKVQDQPSFVQFVEKLSAEIHDTKGELLNEIEHFLKQVSKSDKSFLGNVVASHSGVDGLKMPVDSLTIYWEVTSKEFKDFEVSCPSKDKFNLSVKFRISDLNNCFKQRFYSALTRTLKEYKFQSHDIWLSYPSIEKHSLGAMVFLVMQDKAKACIRLIKVILVPILQTDYLTSKSQIFVHKAIRGSLQKESLVFIANLNKDQWLLKPVKLEAEIFRRLSRDQLLVLNGSKLLMKILYSCWWLPRIESRRHNHYWQSYVSSLTTLTPNELTSFFLEELNNTTDEDWIPAKHLDRLISLLKRAKQSVRGGEIKSTNISQMFVNNDYSSFKAGYLVDSTVQILECLKNE